MSAPSDQPPVQPPVQSFASVGAAYCGGLRAGLSLPALVLVVSFIGFGALAREAAIPFAVTWVSTITVWALPAQVVMAEMVATGSDVTAIAIAVSLSSARFFPMTLVLAPLLRPAHGSSIALYIAAHFIAITGWAAAMRWVPVVDRAARIPYFFGFATILMSGSAISTICGYLFASALPSAVVLGLVFVNPIYFMLVFVGDVRHRPFVLALAFGAIMGPLVYLVTPDWVLLVTGLLAGSAAFAAERGFR